MKLLVLGLALLAVAVEGFLSECADDGELQKNPNDCRKFDACVFGQWVTYHCPPGHMWSDLFATCVYGECTDELEMEHELKVLPEIETLPKACPTVKKADIVVVVDSSSSVKESGWQKQLQFLQKLIYYGGLPIGADAVQVGMVRFSTYAQMVFPLYKYDTASALNKAIGRVEYKGGVTYTNKAIKMARSMLRPGMGGRQRTQKVVIVLTDGASNDFIKTKKEAAKLHKEGIKVIAIGVGNTNPEELSAIASEQKYVLHTNSLDKLIEEDFIEEKVLDRLNCIAICPTIQKADVFLLVDVSGSIQDEGFLDQKFFVKSIINSLDVGQDNVRIGVAAFSQHVQKLFGLDNMMDKSTLIEEVERMDFQRAITNTHLGLLEAGDVYFSKSNGGRKDVPQILIVLSDGKATEHDAALEAAEAVKSLGVKIITIGVGDKVDLLELQDIATEPKGVILARDHRALKNLDFIKNEVIQGVALWVSLAESCSREMSRVVSGRVAKVLQPIYDEYNTLMSARCPLHPSRNKYAAQEAYKVEESPSRWRCDYCGKTFWGEPFLDLHMDNRHSDSIKNEESSVCLADWCDVFRCEVLAEGHRMTYWTQALCKEKRMKQLKQRCQNMMKLCMPEGVEHKEMQDLLEDVVCRYLTCEDYADRSDVEFSSTPTVLYTVGSIFLIFVCVIYYVIAWTHFYDEPMLDSRHVYEEERDTDLTCMLQQQPTSGPGVQDVRQRARGSS